MNNPLDQAVQERELAALLRRLDQRLTNLERAAQLPYSAARGQLHVVDDAGTIISTVGRQADGTVGVTVAASPPPPTPLAPLVQPATAALNVTWDGQWVDAYSSPLNLSHVEVHVGEGADFTPSPQSMAATLAAAGASITLATTTYTPLWVRLVAVNAAGARGPASAATKGTALKVVSDDLVDGIIGELQIANSAITAAKIALGAINSSAIAEAAITASKIGQAAVIAGKLAADSVTPGTIASNTVTAREITAGAITTAKLAAGAVTAAELAAGAVTAGKIAAGTITATELATNAVIAGKIAADAVTAGTIAANAVTAREIKAGTITADRIAANSITAGQLAAGAVTAAKLSADAIDGKTITGVTLVGSTIQTALTGRRVLLSPTDPTDGSANPSALLYSGASTEKAPARLTAEVRAIEGGAGTGTGTSGKVAAARSVAFYSAATARLTAPQMTTDGSHTPRLQLSSGGPNTGYVPQGMFSLSASGPGLAGEAFFGGAAGSGPDADGLVYAYVRRFSDLKSAIEQLRPDSWSIQLADQIATISLDTNGLAIKALQGEVLIQTQTGLRVQYGDITLQGGGFVKNDATWITPTLNGGATGIDGWQAPGIKAMPDGTVALRGLIQIPASFPGGVIATIDDPALRPRLPEIFAVANANESISQLYVKANGDIETWKTTGGWISLDTVRWSIID
ncbi:hypothetical protein [Kitasatospora sp. NPDC090091]|uniref:hypothetical protein n=1 Tax=Kitasatospora sp. NPDC090091 TaxID=3364081 RepID=UPI0037FB5B00